MQFIPPLALLNRYYIGDTVLLTGIAESLTKEYDTEVYVISNYSELLANHPYAIPKSFDQMDTLPDDCRIIDMSESIRSIREEVIIGKDGEPQIQQVCIENKLNRMYEKAGCSQRYIPKLYLSEMEKEKGKNFRKAYGGKLVGIGIGSRHECKIWSYFDLLVNRLHRDFNIFIIDNSKERCFEFEKFPIKFMTDLSLRELMIDISVMDLVISNDTATAHIASALDVPTIALGYNIWGELYGDYTKTCYLGSNVPTMRSISVKHVINKSKKLVIKGYYRKRNGVALMLLEGLGGTITLSDHSKKVHEKYGEKPTLIIRKNPELFDNNPNVADVVVVGTPRYDDIVPKILKNWQRIAIIKTGIGKWYGIKQDFSKWEELYNNHPIGINALESYGLNMIQLANMSLGLPYDAIESKIFRFDEPKIALPDKYIVISNGVDTWHEGLKQTKCWEDRYWQMIVDQIDIPVIQVGTNYDKALKDVIDLRGKTSILEMFFVLKNASAIICTEGGLMHLGYAVGNPNTIVLRGPTRGNFYGYKSQHQIDSEICELCYWDNGDWYKDCVKGIGSICMKSITPERVLIKLQEVLCEGLVENTQSASLFMDSRMAVPERVIQAVGI